MKIKDLPEAIKEVALQRQREQGLQEDENVDLSLPNAFVWHRTAEDSPVWHFINHGNYEPFYALYPDKRPKPEYKPGGEPEDCSPEKPPAWEPKTGERVTILDDGITQYRGQRIFLFKNKNLYACVLSQDEDKYSRGEVAGYAYWQKVEPVPEVPVSIEDIASWKGCKPEQIKIV